MSNVGRLIYYHIRGGRYVILKEHDKHLLILDWRNGHATITDVPTSNGYKWKIL